MGRSCPPHRRLGAQPTTAILHTVVDKDSGLSGWSRWCSLLICIPSLNAFIFKLVYLRPWGDLPRHLCWDLPMQGRRECLEDTFPAPALSPALSHSWSFLFSLSKHKVNNAARDFCWNFLNSEMTPVSKLVHLTLHWCVFSGWQMEKRSHCLLLF